MEKSIHWYPGHMNKALNELKTRIKILDVILILVDSRAPLSSLNKGLFELVEHKPHIFVLMKMDLADPTYETKWLEHFRKEDVESIFVSIDNKKTIDELKSLIYKMGEKKREKEIRKGIKPQRIKTAIIGVPNVGKSSLINKLAGKKIAVVENKPGKTKNEAWIKVGDKFDLLDTPGILPPRYENKEISTKLALIGMIKESILPIDYLVEQALIYLRNYKDLYFKKYDYELVDDVQTNLLNIAKRRMFMVGNNFDLDKASIALLRDFKNGHIGRMTLENPE